MHDPFPPLTRFAPAPTGFLHLGHVANAVYAWGLAGARRGRVLLRIEDHDRQRCRPELEQALLDDLDWLGFRPDVYPTAAFRAGACGGRQSDRDSLYRAALASLIQDGLVYGCDCSRRQIEETTAANTELRYPGTCRDRGVGLGENVGWRLRLSPGIERFDDLLRGLQVQDPSAQCGDLLVRDRRGNWTYQWAVTVDDMLQDITLVVRGMDLLVSTGRQILVARMLGRDAPPVFAHHPLLMKSATQKLSKSDGDTGVRDLRNAGWSAARVIGQAAWLAGLLPRPRPLDAEGVSTIFDA